MSKRKLAHLYGQFKDRVNYGRLFMVGFMVGACIAADVLVTHLMLPDGGNIALTKTVYRILITKWFLAGIGLGMALMFCVIESWMWRNWRSWNRFCCDHHERVYRSAMGFKKI